MLYDPKGDGTLDELKQQGPWWLLALSAQVGVAKVGAGRVRDIEFVDVFACPAHL